MTDTNEAHFKLGDVVQLQSGGPNMTISELPNPATPGYREYKCTWFSGVPNTTPQFIKFEEELLFLVNRKK
jgi:uncharacterized protein YodC (DUF2158 family)